MCGRIWNVDLNPGHCSACTFYCFDNFQLSVSTTCAHTGSLEPPSLSPMRDTLIPIDSPENVTYICETEEQLTIIWQLNGRQIQGSMARATYRNINIFIDDTVEMTQAISTLVVTREGRGVLGSEPIPVQCHVFNEVDFSIIGGSQYYIIQFGESAHIQVPVKPIYLYISCVGDYRIDHMTVSTLGYRHTCTCTCRVTIHQHALSLFSSCVDAPSPPRNLQLNYRSDDQLILQWERPAGLHEDVDVTL